MAERLSIRIDLEGAEEVERQLADIGEAGEKAFEDITKAAEQAGGFEKLDPKEVTKRLEEMGTLGAESIKRIQDAVNALSFQEATKSIAGLGKTSQQALDGAAKAAEKFGASQQQFQSVESTIRSLAARSRDSSRSFQELAQNYDRARGSIANIGTALTTASTSLRQIAPVARDVGQSTGTLAERAVTASAGVNVLTQSMLGLRSAIIPARLAASELGLSLAGLTTLFRAGPIGLIIGALGGLELALENAGDKARRLQQRLVDSLRGAGVGKQAFAELEEAARKLGIPVEKLIDTFLKLRDAAEKTRTFKFVVPPGAELPDFANTDKQLVQLITRLGEVGRAADMSGNDIAKVLDRLAEDIKRSGGLTGDAFRRLNEQAPAMARALQNAFGQGSKSAEEFARDLDKSQKKFNELSGIAPKIKLTVDPPLNSIEQEIERLKSKWNELQVTADKKLGFNIGVEAIKLATTGLEKLIELIKNFKTPSIDWEGFKQEAEEAWNTITMAIQNATTVVGNFIAQMALIVWDTISSGAVAAWNIVTTVIQNAATAVTDFVSQMASITWDTISTGAVAAWNAVAGAIQSALDWLTRFITKQSEVRPPPETPSGLTDTGIPTQFARGGLISGRGSATSDSNLAWVSRGEHIMPARAVQQPGVLAFLEALRRSGGNLERVLDQMGRFALGGMVPRMIPAFATGGLVGSQSNVTIQFPGLPPITGLKASSDTIEELRRAAAMAQVRSGGRKPSRYS